jgi:hypothetical protein
VVYRAWASPAHVPPVVVGAVSEQGQLLLRPLAAVLVLCQEPTVEQRFIAQVSPEARRRLLPEREREARLLLLPPDSEAI